LPDVALDVKATVGRRRGRHVIAALEAAVIDVSGHSVGA
jgi:hypothetical protein